MLICCCFVVVVAVAVAILLLPFCCCCCCFVVAAVVVIVVVIDILFYYFCRTLKVMAMLFKVLTLVKRRVFVKRKLKNFQTSSDNCYLNGRANDSMSLLKKLELDYSFSLKSVYAILYCIFTK